ncbi:MAG: hypothetical protein U1E41_14430 [Paracoccus sp. (in: a-proteobacteria)]|jgi:hypothetical protein
MAWMKYFAALPVLQAIDLVRCISIPDQTDRAENQYGYLPPAFSAASVDSENSGVMARIEKCPGHTGAAIRDFASKRPPVSRNRSALACRLPLAAVTAAGLLLDIPRRFSTRDFAQKVLDGTASQKLADEMEIRHPADGLAGKRRLSQPFVEHAHQRRQWARRTALLQSPGSCPRRSDGRIPVPCCRRA